MLFSTLDFLVILNVFEDNVNRVLTSTARMFRPLRGIRLLELSPGLRMLVRTFYYSLSAIFNVASLTMMLYFIYAVLGVQVSAYLQLLNTGYIITHRPNLLPVAVNVALFDVAIWRPCRHSC
eukprot:SAG31_NODE_2397_length_5784_cov_5.338962_5_plen_122_part_00